VSDLGLEPEPVTRHHSRRTLGCVAVLVALAILAGAGAFALLKGRAWIADLVSPPEDYTGSGTTPLVVVEVHKGDTATDIADSLFAKDVVKSTEAFTDAAREDSESKLIQVGRYRLRQHLPAKAALAALLDDSNRLVGQPVTLPEGLTVKEIIARLADHTRFSSASLNTALSRVELPSYANGNPEGYLFPATYNVTHRTTPVSLFTAMVTRFDQEASAQHLAAKADAMRRTPGEIITVASLVQAEARRAQDFPKVARVVYNRLDRGMRLELDSTVHYAVGKDGSVSTTRADRQVDSPYNTYRYAGLPPGPIDAPGEQAIKAALNPAQGSWLYFVTVNTDTGETKFATTFAEHQKNVAEYRHFCRSSPDC
jgi:peptidoglycan lytic transglycosylase G